MSDAFYEDSDFSPMELTDESMRHSDIATSSSSNLRNGDARRRGSVLTPPRVTTGRYTARELVVGQAAHTALRRFEAIDGDQTRGRADPGIDPSKTIARAQPIVVACGTELATETGLRAVESLAIGDRILAASGDMLVVTKLERRSYSELDLDQRPALRPIRLRAGSLGAKLPPQDLVVAPDVAIHIADKVCADLFGAEAVAVPAKALLNDHSVTLEGSEAGVAYVEFWCDRSGVIEANGTALVVGGMPQDSIPTETGGTDVAGSARPVHHRLRMAEAAKFMRALCQERRNTCARS